MKFANLNRNSKWGNIKNGVKRVWGKISENELENTGGDLEAVCDLIEKKYVNTPLKYRDKVTAIYKRRLKNIG